MIEYLLFLFFVVFNRIAFVLESQGGLEIETLQSSWWLFIVLVEIHERFLTYTRDIVFAGKHMALWFLLEKYFSEPAEIIDSCLVHFQPIFPLLFFIFTDLLLLDELGIFVFGNIGFELLDVWSDLLIGIVE